MTELLSISEYSKIRKCSVSAVYKRLKSPSNRIHNFVVQEDGQTFLKAEILAAEGLDPLAATGGPPQKNFSEAPINPSTTTPTPDEEVENPVEEGIGVLAIKVLEQQLAEKDKQIEDLNRRLNEAAQHEREMTDRLADLLAQANELQRNNQILLAQANQPKQIEAAPAPDPDPIDPVEEPKQKRPWYKKLFGVK
jgi:TolA-binding protein